MVRAALKLHLETHEGWSVCAEAENGQYAVQKALDLNPDVVLLDASMPNLNGLEAAETITKHLPSATIYFVAVISFSPWLWCPSRIMPQLPPKRKGYNISQTLALGGG